jgi:hypothetical protein
VIASAIPPGHRNRETIMQRNKFLAIVVIAGGVLGVVPAFAGDGEGFVPPVETFVGRFMSKTAACPSLDFHLTEATNKKITGLVFDPMMSGQMSSAAGEVGDDGTVHLMLTAMGGKGPTGAIDGTMQGSAMVLSMASATCPISGVKLMPVQREIAGPAG